MYEISTITLSVSFNNSSTMNLYNIANFIDIDNVIIGLKYLIKPDKILIRGKYLKDTMTFYNQISMIMIVNGKALNVKIFNNGSLHITGCKSVETGDNVVAILKKYYIKMSNQSIKIDLMETKRGALVTEDYMLYSKKFKQVVGYVDENSDNWLPIFLQNLIGYGPDCVFVINKDKVVLNKDGNFMSIKAISNRKNIYNLDGVHIGNTNVSMFNNSLKLYKHKNLLLDYEKDEVTTNGDVIGKILYNYNLPNEISDIQLGEDNYSCSPFMSSSSTLQLSHSVNVNCINIVFDIGYKINRMKLFDILKKKEHIALYNPDKYSGVRLIFKSINYKISFMIFQSGKIIGSGFKSIHDINIQIDILKTLFDENRKDISIEM